MDTIFSESENNVRSANAPLAVRVRPTTLDGYVGQQHVVGEGTWLRRAIETDSLSSVLLYGPAGTGKTTLARIIAGTTHAEFVEVSAISGTVKDLRREIEAADRRLLMHGTRTILFVDEIHRFSRSQQDALLHAVENRTVVLIGATTENPYFEVNTALISRSRVVELRALSDEDLREIVEHAVVTPTGLNGGVSLDSGALEALVRTSAGDARSILNSLELSYQVAKNSQTDEGEITISVEDVEQANPRSGLPYDKNGDMHYDVVSAFIKSMRGSDPDAAVYWLARMIDAGEDPKYIARRMMIHAAEDVGNADPQALLIAEAAFKSAEVIGYPECRIILSQAAIYIAMAPKSNASYVAINRAMVEVSQGPLRDVPSALRDRHRPGSDEYGPYLYPHAFDTGYVEQQYLPDGLEKGQFYRPSQRGWEDYRFQAVARDRRPRKNKS